MLIPVVRDLPKLISYLRVSNIYSVCQYITRRPLLRPLIHIQSRLALYNLPLSIQP